jgi:hypothetical protein
MHKKTTRNIWNLKTKRNESKETFTNPIVFTSISRFDDADKRRLPKPVEDWRNGDNMAFCLFSTD